MGRPGARRNLVLLGGPSTNTVVAGLVAGGEEAAAGWPEVRFDEGGYTVGDCRYERTKLDQTKPNASRFPRWSWEE